MSECSCCREMLECSCCGAVGGPKLWGPFSGVRQCPICYSDAWKAKFSEGDRTEKFVRDSTEKAER